VPVGPVENTFLPLYRPNTTTIIAYKSRRAALVYQVPQAVTDDDVKWLWKQAFGDDENHRRPGALVRTYQTGQVVLVGYPGRSEGLYYVAAFGGGPTYGWAGYFSAAGPTSGESK
jgi:hypothetical protein